MVLEQAAILTGFRLHIVNTKVAIATDWHYKVSLFVLVANKLNRCAIAYIRVHLHLHLVCRLYILFLFHGTPMLTVWFTTVQHIL